MVIVATTVSDEQKRLEALQDQVKEAMLETRANAMSMLEKYDERRRDLLSQLREITESMEKLKDVVNAANLVIHGNQLEPADSAYDRAECRRDVVKHMLVLGGPVRVPNLIAGIKETTGHDWATSTIYGVLKKLSDEGIVIKENNTWRMKN